MAGYRLTITEDINTYRAKTNTDLTWLPILHI